MIGGHLENFSAPLKAPVMTDNNYCPLCQACGRKSALQTYQINLSEAITMCPQAKCTYPLGCGRSASQIIQPRCFTNPDVLRKRNVQPPTKPQVPHVPFSGQVEMNKPRRGFDKNQLINSNINGVHAKLNDCLKNDLFSLAKGTKLTDIINANVSNKSCESENVKRESNGLTSALEKVGLQNSQKTVSKQMFNGYNSKVNNSHNLPLSNEQYNAIQLNSTYSDNLERKTSEPNLRRSNASLKSPCKNIRSYLQWCNRDAMCWLDVSMCLLLHCTCFCKLLEAFKTNITSSPYHINSQQPNVKVEYLLSELYSVYSSARDSLRQALDFQRCAQSARAGRLTTLQMSIGRITVRTGGGASNFQEAKLSRLIEKQQSVGLNGGVKSLDQYTQTPPKRHEFNHPINPPGSPVKSIMKRPKSVKKNQPQQSPRRSPQAGSQEWEITPQELDDRACLLIKRARENLEAIRSKLWASLQPALRCELGKNDSPVFALPIMMRESERFEEHFTVKYYWQMDCTQCGYHHIDRQSRPLPSFPAVPDDFCMLVPHFLRPCFQCQAPSQRMTLIYQHLPEALIGHFVEGLHEPCMSSYDFLYHGALYAVRGVVQYVNHPDHFVAWIRDSKTDEWMECDGLKADVCCFSEQTPNFSPGQIHLVMWECVGSPLCNVPVTATAQRLMAGCQQVLPLPGDNTQTASVLGDSVLISSSDNDSPLTVLGSKSLLERTIEANTTAILPATSYNLHNGVSSLGRTLSIPGGIKLLNSGDLGGNHESELLSGYQPSDRTAKQLGEITRFISESMKNPDEKSVFDTQQVHSISSHHGNTMHSPPLSMNNINRAECKSNDSEDRLQRMRDKLQMMRSQSSGSNISQLNEISSASSNSSKSEEKKRLVQENLVGHLNGVSSRLFKSPDGSSSASTKLSFYDSAVMRSPSQRKSSVQALLARIKGTAKQSRSGAQAFDGYKPKFLGKSPKRKDPTSPKKTRSKKISFGEGVTGGKGRGKKQDGGLVKRKVGIVDSSEPAVKINRKGKDAVNGQLSINITAGNSMSGTSRKPKSILMHSPVKRPRNNIALVNKRKEYSQVIVSGSSIAELNNKLGTRGKNSIDGKSLIKRGIKFTEPTIGVNRNHVKHNASTTSSTRGASNNVDAVNVVNGDRSQAVHSTNYSDSALDNVMSELCAQLDIPDKPKVNNNKPQQHFQTVPVDNLCSQVDPVEALLNMHMPQDLNDSMDFDPSGFDLLFSESPVKV